MNETTGANKDNVIVLLLLTTRTSGCGCPRNSQVRSPLARALSLELNHSFALFFMPLFMYFCSSLLLFLSIHCLFVHSKGVGGKFVFNAGLPDHFSLYLNHKTSQWTTFYNIITDSFESWFNDPNNPNSPITLIIVIVIFLMFFIILSLSWMTS